MTDDKLTYRERVAARDAYERSGEAAWGMHYQPDSARDPVHLAYEARQRGDRLFQVDLPLIWVQGAAGIGTASTRQTRLEVGSVLGQIEEQGWRLEHVSTTFVEHGSSASKKVMANAGSTVVATHGAVVAVYVFRAS